MTEVNWKAGSSGNWNTASNWDTGALPAAGDDVFISVSGVYTVSLTVPVTVDSIIVGDNSAQLQIQDPGASRPYPATLPIVALSHSTP